MSNPDRPSTIIGPSLLLSYNPSIPSVSRLNPVTALSELTEPFNAVGSHVLTNTNKFILFILLVLSCEPGVMNDWDEVRE